MTTACCTDPLGLPQDLASIVRQLTAQIGITEDQILGIGIGVAGWVDTELGIVRRHARLNWQDVPLARIVGESLHLPCVVEDQVRALALGEAWFGSGRHADTFALFYVGAFIGCSVVFGRRVHRGFTGSAGGIGRLPALPALPAPPAPPVLDAMPRPVLPPESHDAVVPLDLDSIASEPALYQRAVRMPPVHPHPHSFGGWSGWQNYPARQLPTAVAWQNYSQVLPLKSDFAIPAMTYFRRVRPSSRQPSCK